MDGNEPLGDLWRIKPVKSKKAGPIEAKNQEKTQKSWSGGSKSAKKADLNHRRIDIDMDTCYYTIKFGTRVHFLRVQQDQGCDREG